MYRLTTLSNKQKAVLIALGLSVSFASMSVWIRMMGDGFDDFQQSYLRILGAGILAFLLFRHKFSHKFVRSISRREWKVFGARAIIGYLFGTALFTIAIQNADLSVVALISAVPTLGLVAFIMFREKMPLASIPFLVLSAVGVLIMMGASFQGIHFGIGELAAIVATFGFSISFVMARLHSKTRSNFENTTILLLIGWIPTFAVSMALHENLLPSSLSVTAIIGLLLASLFNVINLYGSNYMITHLKAYVAGNILLLEVLWASVFGLVLFGEPITMSIAAGGMLIVASALAVNRIDKKDEEVLVS